MGVSYQAMKTVDIPNAVAERMRVSSSEEARKKLNTLGIDGTYVDEKTGYMHCKFRGSRRVDATKHHPDGKEEPVNMPVDGFVLDPSNDWALVSWFLQAPPPN